MATIRNKKKVPLSSLEEVRTRCPQGFYVIQPESNPILIADARNPQEHWWVDDPDRKIRVKLLSVGFFHTLVRL